jgi:hypothetical protein
VGLSIQVDGFHEARLRSVDVARRHGHVEAVVGVAKRVLRGGIELKFIWFKDALLKGRVALLRIASMLLSFRVLTLLMARSVASTWSSAGARAALGSASPFRSAAAFGPVPLGGVSVEPAYRAREKPRTRLGVRA